MYRNTSSKNHGTSRMAEDLTKREISDVAISKDHVMNMDEHAAKYNKLTEVVMLSSIELFRRIAWRQFATRMGFAKRLKTVSGVKSVDLDGVVSASLMAGLEVSSTLGDYKILGAIINPLLQCEERMIDAGICTQEQFDNGKDDFLERMTKFYERKSETVDIQDVNGSPVRTNKHSKLQASCVDSSSSPQQQAKDEFALFQQYNDIAYLPEMKPVKVLGSIDDAGDPKEPVYEIGPVKRKGKNLDNKKRNHADYINEKGGYDIVRYLNDFSDRFPAISHIGIGQLCPHISTEVDCESLFSTAGFMSHPQRANTDIQTYERLVKGKHCLQRIYCHIPSVYRLYMQRHKSGDWDEKENREDDMFLQVEKEIWKEMYPHHIIDLEEESESNDDVEASVEESKKVDINEKSDEDSRDDKSDGDSSCSSSGSDVVVLESKRRKKKH